MREQESSNTGNITKGNIEKICEKYGFAYRKEGSEHFATVGDAKIEITFTTDGKLPKGRNKFINAARSASPEFQADYPPKSQSAKGKQAVAAQIKVPRLSYVMQLSCAQLKRTIEMCQTALAKKERMESNRAEIETLEQKIQHIEQAISHLDKAELPTENKYSEALSAMKAKLKDLKS